MRRLETRVRQRGEPLTLAELVAKYPPISDEENVAVPLLELWEEEDPRFWRAFRNGERPLPPRSRVRTEAALPFFGADTKWVPRSGPLSAASRLAAEQYLKKRAAHLERVRAALRRPLCRFPVRLDQGYAALLPHLAWMQDEVLNFRLEALLAVERGDVERAFECLENVRLIIQALAEGPFLVDHLVRLKSATMLVEDGERLLSQRSLSAAELEKLSALFEQLRMPDALRRALVVERACLSGVFDMPFQAFAAAAQGAGDDVDGIDHDKYRLGIAVMNLIGLTAADRRLMLETMERGIGLAAQDSPSALQNFEELYATVNRRARKFPPKIISGMFLPALGRAADKFASFESRRRAALAAVAVERYRQAHANGRPNKLGEITPEFLRDIPTDPFDGAPLRYRKLPRGFVIYSLGRDRIDDGGREEPRKGPLLRHDATFTVER